MRLEGQNLQHPELRRCNGRAAPNQARGGVGPFVMGPIRRELGGSGKVSTAEIDGSSTGVVASGNQTRFPAGSRCVYREPSYDALSFDSRSSGTPMEQAMV